MGDDFDREDRDLESHVREVLSTVKSLEFPDISLASRDDALDGLRQLKSLKARIEGVLTVVHSLNRVATLRQARPSSDSHEPRRRGRSRPRQ